MFIEINFNTKCRNDIYRIKFYIDVITKMLLVCPNPLKTVQSRRVIVRKESSGKVSISAMVPKLKGTAIPPSRTKPASKHCDFTVTFLQKPRVPTSFGAGIALVVIISLME